MTSLQNCNDSHADPRLDQASRVTSLFPESDDDESDLDDDEFRFVFIIIGSG